MSENEDHDESSTQGFESKESLEQLLIERHKLTQRTLDYFYGFQGQLAAEIAKVLREYGISGFEVPKHEKKEEIENKLKEAVEKALSYENELHPLHEYVDSEAIEKDDFIKYLIDNLFTPHKRAILNHVGKKDFMNVVREVSEKHYENVQKQAASYIMMGFDSTDERHIKTVQDYLKEMGLETRVEEIAANPAEHITKIYQHVLDKYGRDSSSENQDHGDHNGHH